MVLRLICSLLLISASANAGEFKSLIAFELALAPEAAVKVPRSKCPVCKGTGKVIAGDTVTIVTRECDNCYPDVATEPTPCDCDPCTCGHDCKCAGCKCDPSKCGRPYRAVMFVDDYCGVCKGMERDEFPILKAAGWNIGGRHDNIEVVNLTQRPELRDQYNIRSLPTFLLLKDGREIRRKVGGMSAKALGNWYNRSEPGDVIRQTERGEAEDSEINGSAVSSGATGITYTQYPSNSGRVPKRQRGRNRPGRY